MKTKSKFAIGQVVRNKRIARDYARITGRRYLVDGMWEYRFSEGSSRFTFVWFEEKSLRALTNRERGE